MKRRKGLKLDPKKLDPKRVDERGQPWPRSYKNPPRYNDQGVMLPDGLWVGNVKKWRPPPYGGEFKEWLLRYAKRHDDPVSDFARDVVRDQCWPCVDDLRVIHDHIAGLRHRACEEAIRTLYYAWELWKKPKGNLGFVYFIQRGEDGPIKIGFSHSPPARKKTLQTSNSEELHLRAAMMGRREDEDKIQARFDAHHIRLEWFRPGPDLLAFIKDLLAEKCVSELERSLAHEEALADGGEDE